MSSYYIGYESMSVRSVLFLWASILLAQAVWGDVQYTVLQDNRLCNSGERGRYSEQVCISRSPLGMVAGKKYRCDSRRFGPQQCRAAVISLKGFTVASLLAAMNTADPDLSVRRIVVQLSKVPTSWTQLGNEIDAFLRPRPWWYIGQEPFEWRESKASLELVFSRVQHKFESSLRILAATQYPASQDGCAATPLLYLHRDVKHTGWYSMLAEFAAVHRELPYAVSAVYLPADSNVHDRRSPIGAEDCPNVSNKWECAFLATTSCDLPKVVTECAEPNCLRNTLEQSGTPWALFDSTSIGGKYLNNSSLLLPPQSTEHLYYQSVVRRAKHPASNNHVLTAALDEAAHHKPPQVEYIRPLWPEETPLQPAMQTELDLFTYNLLLRPNYALRSQVGQAIDSFRSEQKFAPTTRCVAAQIRRGERVPEGSNLVAYCLNTERPIAETGCGSVPFAAITLQHVVDSAALLVEESVRTLVVTTDDEEWLDKQRQELKWTRPEWTVVNLRGAAPLDTPSEERKESTAPGTSAMHRQLRGESGRSNKGDGSAHAASGMLLHASIELSRQCEAFVGHFGCAGTMLMYKSLCAQHDQWEHTCPPAFDLQTIKELQIKYE